MNGNASFFELGVPDADVSKNQAFFARVFGWSFNPMSKGGGWFQAPSIRLGLHGNDTLAQIYVFFEGSGFGRCDGQYVRPAARQPGSV
jgi:hypothetical protein